MKTLKENLLVKSTFGAALLTLIYYLVSLIFGLQQEIGFELWSFLANYLVAIILGLIILYSSFQGIKLTLIIFIIYFFIGDFNILIEAFIFNVTNREETIIQILQGLLVIAAFSPIYVYMFKEKETFEIPIFKPRTFISWTWRVILGNILYLVFYITAGMILTIIYPQILQFYEGKIPSFELIIKTQLLLRGFIFVAIAVLMLRTLNLSLFKKSIVIGLTFSIIGGIAPLISPNDIMPDYVRLGHGFEVGISNFLYGMVLAYLLGQKITNRKTNKTFD
jgi:hypothetical protein